jgi:hypothetical protein
MPRGELHSKVVELCGTSAPDCDPACGIELFPKAADLDESRTDALRSAGDDRNFPSGAHDRPPTSLPVIGNYCLHDDRRDRLS